jgi:hypothetical protein
MSNHLTVLDLQRKVIIERYIEAYNQFDVGGMMADLNENIIFKNISGQEITLQLHGISAFETQAVQAKQFFEQRKQVITEIKFTGDVVETWIDYEGKLATDLPNGWKAGEVLALKGKSIFTFADSKIIGIEDIS